MELKIKNIENKILNCNQCERLREVTPIPMPHIYYKNINDTKLFFVARNPGLENDHSKYSKKEFMEIYKKLWWECNVGKYMRKEFGNKIIANHMFFTNVCKCSSPENKELKATEIYNCTKYLIRQITIIKPKRILAFGWEAANLIENIIKNYNLKTVNSIRLYHPSYFRYNPDKRKDQSQIIKGIIRNLQ